VQLRYFEDHETFFLNYGRSISLTNDEDGWEFEQNWQPFPFERLECYKNQRIKDRFTVEMLVEYLGHLGIDAVDPKKYGPRCALFDVPPDIRRQAEQTGIPLEE
jgi:hypothetical protein